MTISLKANAAGNAGQILIGATPVVSLPVASGLPFCKNKLFNGEVTRINQRTFDGNWSAKPAWPGGTIAQNEASYGYDMWCKANITNMAQWIEAGNFRPSTAHTISGIGITTRTETSPASGNWAIEVPFAARNIQVEEGEVATPFELRPISFELSMCQRYFRNSGSGWSGMESSATSFSMAIGFPSMRVAPACTLRSTSVGARIPSINTDRIITNCAIAVADTNPQGAWVILTNDGGNVAGRFIQDRGSDGPFAMSAVI